MSVKPEAKIVAEIRAFLESFPNVHVIKTHGDMYVRNQPDLIVCWEGKMLCLECKREGKDATPAQASELRKWERAGAICGIVRSVEDVRWILQMKGLISS